jgi:hypothetical protein
VAQGPERVAQSLIWGIASHLAGGYVSEMLQIQLAVGNMMKTIILGGALLALACGSAHAASNLVTNGDFSSGVSGFTSGYTYSPGYGWPEGSYDVTTDPNLNHPLWASFGDHTTGAGEMLVLNGSPIADTSAWSQTISVTGGKTYDFTVWVASSYPTSPATLNLSVNGTQVGSTFTASTTTGLWQQFSGDFTASSNSAALSIIDTNLTRSGNDFALDDISVSAVPEPGVWVMMLGGMAILGAMLRMGHALRREREVAGIATA